jgi:peptidoglycan hydrolase-like protein with peptidoglycan-binding domain
MAWRVAVCLDVFRSQINAARPNRMRIDDGTIGDEAHQSRTSDHNPWVKEGKLGIVTALDITLDPKRGVDNYSIADKLSGIHVNRIKYVVSHSRIFSSSSNAWKWQKYSGANKHDHHMHLSVRPMKRFYDDKAPWDFGTELGGVPESSYPPDQDVPNILRLGAKGVDVARLQELLGITADGYFGEETELAVGKYQKQYGLVVDGIAGGYTLRALKFADGH